MRGNLDGWQRAPCARAGVGPLPSRIVSPSGGGVGWGGAAVVGFRGSGRRAWSGGEDGRESKGLGYVASARRFYASGVPRARRRRV